MSGNVDDCLRLGIGLAKKALKLYTPFEDADILLCSPIGLRMIIGDASDEKREFDFLSSIEVLIVDKVLFAISSLAIITSYLGQHSLDAELGALGQYLP